MSADPKAPNERLVCDVCTCVYYHKKVVCDLSQLVLPDLNLLLGFEDPLGKKAAYAIDIFLLCRHLDRTCIFQSLGNGSRLEVSSRSFGKDPGDLVSLMASERQIRNESLNKSSTKILVLFHRFSTPVLRVCCFLTTSTLVFHIAIIE